MRFGTSFAASYLIRFYLLNLLCLFLVLFVRTLRTLPCTQKKLFNLLEKFKSIYQLANKPRNLSHPHYLQSMKFDSRDFCIKIEDLVFLDFDQKVNDLYNFYI